MLWKMEKIRVNGVVHYATEVLPAGGHILLCEEPESPDPRNIGSMVRGDRVDDATEVDCMACVAARPG